MPTNRSWGAGTRCRRPLSPAAEELPQPVVPPGSTLSEMVAAATRDRELHDRVRVRVDGDEVAPAWWSRSRPRPSSRVEITLLPPGRGLPADPAEDAPARGVGKATPA